MNYNKFNHIFFLIASMKDVLAAMYEDKFNSLIQKEKQLMELKNKTKQYDSSKIFKVNQ